MDKAPMGDKQAWSMGGNEARKGSFDDLLMRRLGRVEDGIHYAISAVLIVAMVALFISAPSSLQAASAAISGWAPYACWTACCWW
jgi:membrane associated rhomboid family serine protease